MQIPTVSYMNKLYLRDCKTTVLRFVQDSRFVIGLGYASSPYYRLAAWKLLLLCLKIYLFTVYHNGDDAADIYYVTKVPVYIVVCF